MSTNSRASDRCDLCGYRFGGTFADRVRHLRRSHPRYARALLLRLVAPFVFLATIAGASGLRAPRSVYLVVLVVSFGLLFFGKQRSRSERSKAGARPTVPLRRLAREGGIWIVLLVPIVALLAFVVGRA